MTLKLTDRQQQEYIGSIIAGNAASDRFMAGEPITFEVDRFAWLAALGSLIPSRYIVSVQDSQTDHLAYTVTLRYC